MKSSILTLAALTTASLSSAAGLNPSTLPSDAVWHAHLDVEQLLNSSIGNSLTEKYLGNEEARRGLAALAAILRFDPLKDLSAVTALGWGGDEDDAALILNGQFDADHLITIVRANPAYGELAHKGTAIHSYVEEEGDDAGVRKFAAFAGSSLVLSNRSANVERALDALTGADTSTRDDAAPRSSPILVASADLARLSGMRPEAAVFQHASRGTLVLEERNNMVSGGLTVAAVSSGAASAIENLARGMLGALQLGMAEEPRAAELVQYLTVTRNENDVSLVIRIPVETAVTLAPSPDSI